MAADPKPHDTASGAATQEQASTELALRTAVYQRLGATRFRLWFGDIVRLNVNTTGDAVEVQVPNSFFREWIRNHYSTSLLEAAEVVLGRPMQLSIRINEEVGPIVNNSQPVLDTGRIETESSPITEAVDQSDLSILMSSMPSSAPNLPYLSETQVFDSTGKHRTASLPVSPAVSNISGRIIRRLDDFVTGPGNSFAYAAAKEMAETVGATFNPLVIHSAVGLGKTHLLEGVGYLIRRLHPNLKVIQLTAEAFTNGFLDAMRTGTLSSFRTRFRGSDGIIVDDVHFLAGKRATHEEFLHTFNALMEKGMPIVLAADQHPRVIARLPDELVTRFLAGMVVKIEPPDLTTRRAILMSKASCAWHGRPPSRDRLHC